jgi:putative hemolysin
MNIISLVFHFFGLGLLLMCSSFFSGTETGLTALSKAQIQRIREDKKKSSGAIIRFLDEPRRLFITVLLGNTLVNMAFVSITGSLIYNDLFKGRSPGLAYLVAVLTQTLLLLIFGEITPKTYAIKHSEKFSRAVAQPLWLFSIIIFPFRRALRILTDTLLPLFGVRAVVDKTPLTADEIRAIVKITEEHGALDEEEGEIIHNIFELHDIPAKEAMVPRTEMICLEVSQTIQEAFDMTRQAGHSRLPVYRKKIDNICGIFYVKDMPRWKGLKIESLGGRSVEQITIEEFISNSETLKELHPGHENTLIRPPLFVFKTKKIGALMREMTKEKQQMAILLGEYGEVAGLITVEDIVEEVLGEIFDEYDKLSELTITKDPKDPSSLLIPGFVSLRSINKRLKLRLDLAGVDTIGGYVVRLFGAIPTVGDVVTDKVHGLEFEVLKMTGNRVNLVKLRRQIKKEKKGRHFSLTLVLIPILIIPTTLLSLSSVGASPAASSPEGSLFPVAIFSVLLVFSLLCSFFFSGSETAVVSASKAKIDVLAQQENPRALIIKKLWQQPDKMLGIVLVGTNLTLVAAGVAGLRLMSYTIPGREGLQEALNTIVMTLVILIFCEILPKTTFRAKADSLALRSAPGLWISGLLLRPIVVLITKITNFVVRMAGEEDIEEKQRAMREELKLLAQMGEREGVLKVEQLQMIYRVLDLETVTLEKVMTPLVDVVALSRNATVSEFYQRVTETGFSRIPVYEDRIDNLVGLVNVLDVLYSETSSPNIAPYVQRDIRHEPESKKVYSLLRELKRSRKKMVFVVDEYGGIGGLVTIEDLVEEILGDIRDEKDRDEQGDIHQISDRIIECDGKTEIQFINNLYGMGIPFGDYNTIAGYVISLMERIPKSGEFIETNELKIVVLDADLKSIRKVRIQRKK